MDRNIIVSGAAGNLGKAVVEKFKREGFKVIATIEPDSGQEVEEADDVYEVDVTDENRVAEFCKEMSMQYGDIHTVAMLVGGYAGTTIEESKASDIARMIQLNFFSAFNMVKNFLPSMKKINKGNFLFVGARPALHPEDGKNVAAYALSKGLVVQLADLVAQECKETKIRSHLFVPSIMDTPENRKAMPEGDFAEWVNTADVAEAMHYAATNSSLRNMTFKLYGGV
ncbi:SDR family NAD(P)-dependent oxidoreductase [Anditalea andensis]|uniref:Short-chain dehydrogenase n=1 Tax=Anditalea andensis TaxID=1048983 RepID=A0A074KV51_9BACT|nr:SDR family NAD(P)-dependent oxidoreductase [Anditalea andensis]KEO72799.1 short-chain dehydrogenase [Anditalea andensis]